MRAFVMLLAFTCSISNAFGQTNPHLADQLVTEGAQFFKNKNYRAAIDKFQKSYQISRHAARLQNIARCYELLNEYADAIKYYTEFAIKKYDKITAVNTSLSKMIRPYLEGEKALEKELITYWLITLNINRALDKLPALLPIIAITYYKAKIYDKALEFFKRAVAFLNDLTIADKIGTYLFTKGKLNLELGKYDDAERIFAISVLLTPGNTDTIAISFISLGSTSLSKKSYPEALKFYRYALSFVKEPDLKVKVGEKIATLDALMKKQPAESVFTKKPVVLSEEDRKSANYLFYTGKNMRNWGASLFAIGSFFLIVGGGVYTVNSTAGLAMMPIGAIFDLIGIPLWAVGQDRINKANRLWGQISIQKSDPGKNMRNWGASLFAIGSFFLIVGGGIYTVNSTAGLAMMPIGAIFDLIGIPLLAVGQSKINRTSRLSAQIPLQNARDPFHQIEPLAGAFFQGRRSRPFILSHTFYF